MSKQNDDKKKPFENIFEGLDRLVHLAQELKNIEAEGGRTSQGEVDLGHLRKGMKAMYGFSINTMSGGQPDIQTFGNVKRTAEGPRVDEEREPMVDILEEGEEMILYAEMPGVNESDIKTSLNEDILEIQAQSGKRKYRKEVHLPAQADASGMKSQYNNGILEIRLPRKSAA